MLTARLELRPRRVSDAAVVRQLWTERDPRVPPHRRLVGDGHPTQAELAARIRDEDPASPIGLLTVVRRAERDVVGYCGLIPGDVGPEVEPELAFELLRAVHEQGYATEASMAMIARARRLGLGRLWATVWDWNLASRRVLEKLGFLPAGREGRTGPHGKLLVTTLEL